MTKGPASLLFTYVVHTNPGDGLPPHSVPEKNCLMGLLTSSSDLANGRRERHHACMGGIKIGDQVGSYHKAMHD